jgi:acetyl-CoA carboxylase carboxyltransferase component
MGNRSGAVDHAVDTEEEAFACARRFLSYLSPSVHGLPPTTACDDDPERADESLMNAIPPQPSPSLQNAANH